VEFFRKLNDLLAKHSHALADINNTSDSVKARRRNDHGLNATPQPCNFFALRLLAKRSTGRREIVFLNTRADTCTRRYVPRDRKNHFNTRVWWAKRDCTELWDCARWVGAGGKFSNKQLARSAARIWTLTRTSGEADVIIPTFRVNADLQNVFVQESKSRFWPCCVQQTWMILANTGLFNPLAFHNA